MTKLERLRKYRSRLVAECNQRVDKFILDSYAGKMTPQRLETDTEFIRKVQLRIRLINYEVDRLIAADPRVLQPATV